MLFVHMQVNTCFREILTLEDRLMIWRIKLLSMDIWRENNSEEVDLVRSGKVFTLKPSNSMRSRKLIPPISIRRILPKYGLVITFFSREVPPKRKWWNILAFIGFCKCSNTPLLIQELLLSMKIAMAHLETCSMISMKRTETTMT